MQWILECLLILIKNSVAEQMNKTLMEKAHCMLSNVDLPKSFWVEAASTACFLINHSPSTAIDKRTPQEVWYGTPTSYSNLKMFRCPTYAYVDDGKLEPRFIKCVFLGYKSGVKGYKFWCSKTNKVMVNRDVLFYKTSIFHDSTSKDSCDKKQ